MIYKPYPSAPGGFQNTARDLMIARTTHQPSYNSAPAPRVEHRQDAVQPAAGWSAAVAREVMLRRIR